MIILIDNYDSFVYNLYQAIAPFYPDIKVLRNDAISVNALLAMQPKAILLSPGPGRPETAGICLPLLQNLPSTIPFLGICLGHQALTLAMGGKILTADNIIHGKKDLIFHCRQGLYRNLPLPFEAGRYHSFIVERQSLPETLQIEAENATGVIMGIKHRDYPWYGVQFHPESILTPQGTLLLQNFLQLC